MYTILLVEDDTSLGYLLTEYLSIKGFKMSWTKNAEEALQLLESYSYDLIILDVMLPDLTGFDLAKKIAATFNTIPFLFLTARSLKVDVLKGFALGAVDYLKKPIDEEELFVRINALLSRLSQNPSQEENAQEFKLGNYLLNARNMELIFEGKPTRLTSKECELLVFLAMQKNQLCSHKEILITLWGKNDYFNRKSLNVFISRLRKYLSQDDSLKIENIHRRGFILREWGLEK